MKFVRWLLRVNFERIFQTVSGAHPAFCLMGNGDSFPGSKAAGAWSWSLISI